MFIGRRPDGTVYGAWSMKQANDESHPGLEEVAHDHPDLLAFRDRPRRQPKTLVEQLLENPEQLQLLKEALRNP